MSAGRFRAPRKAMPTIEVRGGYDISWRRHEPGGPTCSHHACKHNGKLGDSPYDCPRCHGTGVEMSAPRRSRKGLQMRRRSVQAMVRKELRRARGAS